MIGPLLLGHATTLYDGPFTVESTYRVIRKYGITNLAGAPTAFRLLRLPRPSTTSSWPPGNSRRSRSKASCGW